MTEWNDRTKFTAETVRTVLLAVAGAAAATLIVKPSELLAAYRGEVARTQLAVRAKVIDDLCTSSTRYTAAAHDACRAYAKTDDTRTDDERRTISLFESEVVDTYRRDLERVSVYFNDSAGVRAEVDRARALQRQFYWECTRRPPSANWDSTRDSLKAANHCLAMLALSELNPEKEEAATRAALCER